MAGRGRWRHCPTMHGFSLEMVGFLIAGHSTLLLYIHHPFTSKKQQWLWHSYIHRHLVRMVFIWPWLILAVDGRVSTIYSMQTLTSFYIMCDHLRLKRRITYNQGLSSHSCKFAKLWT